MALGNDQGSSSKFASIKDGSIRVRTQKGDDSPNYVERTYINPTTSEKGIAYELKYTFLEGHINSIFFSEKDWGTTINIQVDDIILSTNVTSRYAADLMKKLPNVDLTKDVNIRPYDFESEDGKRIVGVSITQEEVKVMSAFSVKDENGKWKSLNGMPEPDKKESKRWDKDDWKIYFVQVKKFLVKYIQDNVIGNVVGENSLIVDIPIASNQDWDS